MIANEDIISIEKLINNKIINSELLSSSFGINCIRILTSDNNNFIAKYYRNPKRGFDAIKSETNNLITLNNLNLKIFPKVCFSNSKYLIISFLDNDGMQPKKTKKDFLNAIISIHKLTNNHFGFSFDTQIGGLKQINRKSYDWIDFFKEYRLGYIFDIISMSDPMEKSINNKIDFLLKNLHNYIPKKPNISLLHGDLWEGNILFKNNNFVGLIDPGSFYGHNELEIAYLRWFNSDFIDQFFLEKYGELIKIDKDYLNYEPIYQLYYSLLNVHLWDRKYIQDVCRLLDKIKV